MVIGDVKFSGVEKMIVTILLILPDGVLPRTQCSDHHEGGIALEFAAKVRGGWALYGHHPRKVASYTKHS